MIEEKRSKRMCTECTDSIAVLKKGNKAFCKNCLKIK